ncbi:MAG: hypothetical protein WCR01_09460 [Bacteroidota bacterium]
MKKLLFLLIPALLVMAGCKKTGTSDEPVKSPEIFPLSIGYHWDFTTTTSDKVKTTHVNDVINDTLIDGEKWFVLTYDHSVRTICRNNSSGWWFLYQSVPQSPVTPLLYYRYPVSGDEVYMTPDSTKVTVVSVNDIVTVPAGKFACYRYHMIHYREGYECDEYLSPGTGLVLHVIYAPGIGSTKVAEVTELEKFN